MPYRAADFYGGAPLKLQFIRRRRVAHAKGRQVMSEEIGDSMADCIVNQATGYHVVGTDTSVVFYDIDSTGMSFYAPLSGITLRRATA